MSIFNKIKVRKPKRSTFNLSHNTKLTFPWGQLIPVYWNYFEPNTKFKASSIIQARTMPMLAPIMHEVNIYSYWFQIPIRLLMSETDYSDFITGGRTGDRGFYVNPSAENPVVLWPKYKAKVSQLYEGDYALGPLLDYLDFPARHCYDTLESTDEIKFDAVPLRAYGLIWNEYFRDQNTTERVPWDNYYFTGEYDLSPDNLSAQRIYHLDLLQTKARCWTKDYFTSALPWAQRGSNVDVPFTALTELAMDGNSPSYLQAARSTDTLPEGNALTLRASTNETSDGDYTGRKAVAGYNATSSVDMLSQVDVTKHTKARTTISGTINDLRTAYSLQRWKERNALGGSRYIEQINAHFNVWADDYRLQRPLFLGGSRSPLQISEVLQTSESTTTSVQGNPTGRGYTMDNQGNVHCFVKEHSIIMNIICVTPKAAYFQGVPRKFDIRDRFDFPWPLLAHLGEQEVREGEIYYQANQSLDDAPFGYQSRYAQYKYEPNRIHGEFQNTLLFWHLARKFAEAPTNSRSFMECTGTFNGLNRIFPVLDDTDVYAGVGTQKFWAQINYNIKVKRPLPYFGTPNL